MFSSQIFNTIAWNIKHFKIMGNCVRVSSGQAARLLLLGNEFEFCKRQNIFFSKKCCPKRPNCFGPMLKTL